MGAAGGKGEPGRVDPDLVICDPGSRFKDPFEGAQEAARIGMAALLSSGDVNNNRASI